MAETEDKALQRMAEERGLPPTASWADITTFDDKQALLQMAAERGLPPTASWTDITTFDNEQSHKH